MDYEDHLNEFSDDDPHAGYSDDDIDAIQEECFKALESKPSMVENADGTLRCPYSPSRKKQSYPYKDLLQHAEGVAKGKRGAEAAGQHMALVQYLKTRLAAKATPPVQRQHKLQLRAPERKVDENLLVCPWAGVLYNIDNSKYSEDGKSVGPSNSEIKEHFRVYKPEKANVLWGPRGHMGIGILLFRRDLEGLKDAQDFEKSFIDKGHGRRDWVINYERRQLGKELYGWLARKDDYDGRKEFPNDWMVSKYLRDVGDLKDVVMIGEEINKMHEQRFEHLKETVYAKNEEFEILLHDVEVARRKAEEEKRHLEEKYKRELEEVKRGAEESALQHLRVMKEKHENLQRNIEHLKERCKELEVKEEKMQNQEDRKRLELEKQENQYQEKIFNRQKELQKKHQSMQVKLIKKHEEEDFILAQEIQRMTLELRTRQEAEMESQRRGEVLDSKKLEELVEGFEKLGTGSGPAKKSVKELEDEIEALGKKYAEVQEKLESTEEDFECKVDEVNVLVKKERLATEELENARKLSLKAMSKYGSRQGIHIKRMGEIEMGPWKRSCQERFKNKGEGWDVICSTKFSAWEEKVKNHNFRPYKDILVREDKRERVFDKTDAEVVALRGELGEEVAQTVETCMMEIEEYNPSGRYPVAVVWNYKLNVRATLSDVIDALMKVCAAANGKKKVPVKRRRLVTDDMEE